MDYGSIGRKEFLESELSELEKQEAETEYIIEYLPRKITVNGTKRVLRLPRHTWVSLDRLIDGEAMTIEELLDYSQLGAEDRPHRTYEQNIESFVRYAIHRLNGYL